jgi:predicted nucleic acid-binding protein
MIIQPPMSLSSASRNVIHAIPSRLIDMALKQAMELSARLNVYAYDAYVIACAVNQRAPILTLDRGLIERARELKLDVLEVNVP